jgi:hypothetical protein
MMKNTLTRLATLAFMAIALPVLAEAPAATPETKPRGVIVAAEAVVTAVDLETRQVSLKTPSGQIATITATEELVKLEDIKVGDILHATYLAAIEGELREPTEAELAEPWVVVEDGGKGVVEGTPMIGQARMIRAVCTIEGMNRLLGTVTLLDSNGKAHVIGDVEPEKMAGVTLGQTVVVVYEEALALTLEHVPAE